MDIIQNSLKAVGINIFLHFYESRNGGGQSAIFTSPKVTWTLTNCSLSKATVSLQGFGKVAPHISGAMNCHSPIKASEILPGPKLL